MCGIYTLEVAFLLLFFIQIWYRKIFYNSLDQKNPIIFNLREEGGGGVLD